MKTVETTFEFPRAEDRYILRGVQTYKGLKKILLGLKRSPDYQKFQISYSIRQWKRCNNGPAKHLSVYFRCCNSPKPSIHFVSRDNHRFVLDDKSIYTHHHQKSGKSKSVQKKSQRLTEKIIINQSFIDQQEESQNQDSSEIIQDQNVGKLLYSDEQSLQKIGSEQASLEMDEQNRMGKWNKQKIFDFPTFDLLQKIQTTTSSLCQIEMWGWGIRQHVRLCQLINENGNKFNGMIVEFKCCTVGTDNSSPYLLFEEQKPSIFHLKEYKNIHDHRGRRLRKKYPINSETKKVETKQIKEKENNIVRNTFLNQLPSKKIKVDIDDKITEKRNQKVQQKQKKSVQLKDQSQQNVDLENIQKQIQQNFIAPNNQLKRDSLKFNTFKEGNSNCIQPFKKALKDKKIVIEIASESEDQIKIQKTKYIKKFDSLQQKVKKNQRKFYEHIPVKNTSHEHQITQQMNQINIQSQKNIDIINSNCNNQSSQREQIFCWFENFNKEISNFLIENKWKNKDLLKNFKQQIGESFIELFSQNSIDKVKLNRVWNECIFEMFEWNGIKNLKIYNVIGNAQLNKDKLFQLEGRVFFKPIEGISLFNDPDRQRKDKGVLIYLAVYPIKMINNSQNLKIFIAYTLKSNLQPYILWFCFYKETLNRKSTLQDLLNESQKYNKIYEVLKVSLQYLELKKVNFIYTTLDYQLMNALEKICKEKSLSSNIHLSCLKDIFTNQSVPKDPQLSYEISNRIKSSPNFTKIKDSCQILKSFFEKQKNSQIDKDKKFNNPRIIYENYCTFSEPFCFSNKEQISYTKTMAFFSSEILFYQKENFTIKDPVSEINSIFTRYNQFNDAAEVFMLIIKFFDPKFRNFIKKAWETQMVLKSSFQVQKQCNNFNKILDYPLFFKYPLEKIFAEPAYEMLQIVRKCPRFITQTIYRLIIAANQLSLKTLNESHNSDAKLQINHKDLQAQKKFFVQSAYPNPSLKFQDENDLSNKNKGKDWKCLCKFYKQTGIPCEHVVFDALQNKDSLFAGIHSIWKIKQQ